jgi:hypothetical protein
MSSSNINNNNNNNNNIPSDNVPRNVYNSPDYARLIRYLSTNVTALAAKRPVTRALGLTIANTGNLIADIVSNEEKANYWIDQFNHWNVFGRLRGGQPGSGPFERGTFENGTHPFDNLNSYPDSNVEGQSSNLLSNSNLNSNVAGQPSNLGPNSNNTSNFLEDFNFDFSFIGDFFAPVNHSIPLNTLINVHFMMTFCLFIFMVCALLLVFYFLLNLIILFNKDFFLTKITNKYLLMYIKFVVFKTRIDIFVVAALIIFILVYSAYILHYLIVHPIIL